MLALAVPDLLTAAAVLTTVVYAVGIVSAGHALFRTRTVEGTIAWVVSLVLFPYLALPAYWLLHSFRFQRYNRVLRQAAEEHRDQLGAVYERLTTARRLRPPALPPEAGVLERLAELPFLGGNEVRLLVDGRATFDAIFAAIENARRSVLVQFFIVRDDRLGREFQALLRRKARAGVAVHCLMDGIGSFRLPRRYDAELRADGVAVARFSTSTGWHDRWQLNFRNHRKIVVVDGHTAFVGGHNVGVEYLGDGPLGPWRDTHLEVRGPAALQSQLSFAADWYWATRRVLPADWSLPEPRPANQAVITLPTGPTDEIERCTMFFLHALGMARRRLWIASPYFVPDESIEDALRLAALRGVDVRVLLPGRPDHRLVWLASFGFLDELRGSGIRVWRLREGFMHQKVVLVDEALAAVGTANFDNRSFRLNFELTLAVACPQFAAEVALMLEHDFAASTEVDEDEFRSRPKAFQLACKAARLLGPVL